MNRSELMGYRAMLAAKEAELLHRRSGREEITIEKLADAMDEVQSLCERELAITNLDREATLLQNIHNALARIDDGSYGVCLECEVEINPKRLKAVPWAAYCVRCQEEADRHESESDTASSQHELSAA